MNDLEHCNNTEALWSRRAVLKMIAGAPLVVTFGLVASPLMRFLKPTMKPGNFFQAADFPAAVQPVLLNERHLPDIWSCLPFMLPMKYPVFNAEQYEIREIPGFAIRTGKNQIVAFSRMCPKQSDHVLNYVYVSPTANGSCGCTMEHCKGDCIRHAKTPILVCPCDGSTFDVSNNGRVLCGPARYRLRQFIVNRNGDWISISRFEEVGIA